MSLNLSFGDDADDPGAAAARRALNAPLIVHGQPAGCALWLG